MPQNKGKNKINKRGDFFRPFTRALDVNPLLCSPSLLSIFLTPETLKPRPQNPCHRANHWESERECASLKVSWRRREAAAGGQLCGNGSRRRARSGGEESDFKQRDDGDRCGAIVGRLNRWRQLNNEEKETSSSNKRKRKVRTVAARLETLVHTRLNSLN